MLKLPLYRKIALIVLALTLILLFYAFNLGSYLTVERVQAARTSLQRFYESYRVVTIVGFISVYMVLSALALPGPLVMSLIAGAVFGIATGALYTSIGATVGATLAFLGARYLFGDTIRKRFDERLKGINEELEKEGLWHIIFLRLVSIFPFTMINLAAGLTTIPLRTFFVGTLIGVFPPNLILANAGAGVATITGIGDILSFRVVGSLCLLGVLALAPVIYRRVRRRSGLRD